MYPKSLIFVFAPFNLIHENVFLITSENTFIKVFRLRKLLDYFLSRIFQFFQDIQSFNFGFFIFNGKSKVVAVVY